MATGLHLRVLKRCLAGEPQEQQGMEVPQPLHIEVLLIKDWSNLPKARARTGSQVCLPAKTRGGELVFFLLWGEKQPLPRIKFPLREIAVCDF